MASSCVAISGVWSSSTLKCTNCSSPKVTQRLALRLTWAKAVVGERTSRIMRGDSPASEPHGVREPPVLAPPVRQEEPPSDGAASRRDRTGSNKGALAALRTRGVVGVDVGMGSAGSADSLATGDETLPAPQHKPRRPAIGKKACCLLGCACLTTASSGASSRRERMGNVKEPLGVDAPDAVDPAREGGRLHGTDGGNNELAARFGE